MIHIDIFRNKDGNIFGLRVHGHSGTAERGQDIVCAGISSLAQAAILGICEHLHRDVDGYVDPSGDLQLKLNGAPDDLTQAVFETVHLGFAAIVRANPNAVRMRCYRKAFQKKVHTPGGENK